VAQTGDLAEGDMVAVTVYAVRVEGEDILVGPPA